MFADGRPLGRLNDLVADGRGGAYFTVADQDIRTNLWFMGKIVNLDLFAI